MNEWGQTGYVRVMHIFEVMGVADKISIEQPRDDWKHVLFKLGFEHSIDITYAGDHGYADDFLHAMNRLISEEICLNPFTAYSISQCVRYLFSDLNDATRFRMMFS